MRKVRLKELYDFPWRNQKTLRHVLAQLALYTVLGTEGHDALWGDVAQKWFEISSWSRMEHLGPNSTWPRKNPIDRFITYHWNCDTDSFGPDIWKQSFHEFSYRLCCTSGVTEANLLGLLGYDGIVYWGWAGRKFFLFLLVPSRQRAHLLTNFAGANCTVASLQCGRGVQGSGRCDALVYHGVLGLRCASILSDGSVHQWHAPLTFGGRREGLFQILVLVPWPCSDSAVKQRAHLDVIVSYIPLGIPSKKWYSLRPKSTTVLGPSNCLNGHSGPWVPPFYREGEPQWTMYWNGMHLPFYRTKRLIKNLESTVGGDHSIENYVLDLDITYIIEESTYTESTRGHLLFDRLRVHRKFMKISYIPLICLGPNLF